MIAAGLRRVAPILGALIALGTGSGTIAAELPPGFVPLREVAPQIRQEMRYAGSENFIGRPIAGYGAGQCWLLEAAAAALRDVAADAAKLGWRLVVYDCYRPERAVADFVSWSKDDRRQERKAEYYPDFDKADLFRLGFIATRSQHSRGTTVDIGAEAVDASGKVTPVDFGTPYDTFADNSATASRDIPESARQARASLVSLMAERGFENYRKEWWHFTLPLDPPPSSYDLPITAE